MKKISETIVFFGSGPVAAESLALLARDFAVEAVITKPQPSHHKHPFPVLTLARELGLKTLTANDQAELSTLFKSHPVQSKLGVIVDHGIIVTQDVIDYFPLGIVNSHFSLLPKWRGADPISFAILNGEAQTGVSLMIIVEQLDEGQLIGQSVVPITSDATTPDLTKKLIAVSHKLLVEKLPLYLDGKLQPYPQPARKPTYSRKLTKQDGRLDWAKPANHLEREVRAYTGWPRSRATLGGHEVIITRAHVVDGAGKVGKLWLGAKRQLGIYTSEGILRIDTLIPAGKKEMSAVAFLAGHKL